ncbi:J domain-containing protein 1 [Yarrowia sp. C11]|nr:J domain-containing protein 1 [Yarrowia sp. C11]KAG5370780.1 J domain-containing protein 1 [Yarrowia sp. E02]
MNRIKSTPNLQTHLVLLRTRAFSSSPKCMDYPPHDNPSPYEIFGMGPHNLNQKALKREYYILAKKYHPDSNGSNEETAGLSKEVKDARFRKISNAYEILKNPSRRHAYDRFGQGWEGGRPGPYGADGATSNLYNQASTATAGHGPRYSTHSDGFWGASGWQDYEDLRNHSSKAKQNENTTIIGMALVVVAVVVTYLQIKRIIDVMEDQYFRVKEQNKKLEDSLFWARNNYGFAQGKDDRVSRFLVMRRNSLAEEGDYMEAQLSEDNWRRRKIAEKRAKEAALAAAAAEGGEEVHGKLDTAPEPPVQPPSALEVMNAFSKAELISKAVSLTTKEQVVATTSAVFTDSLMTSVQSNEEGKA